jgi:uncharacterized short protein YbdD (DUF466 family)
VTARAIPTAAPKAPSRLDRVAAVIRRIIGVPDYDRYVAHMTENHPSCTLISRDEFTNQRMYEKYSKPGARCC